jgi:superfamily II DNA/RNA helicase
MLNAVVSIFTELFQALSISLLDSLVIDEADLILSYGHDEDVRQIFSGSFLPKVYQSFLMSATMTEDVELLKGLALRSPVSDPSSFSSTSCYLGSLGYSQT